MFSPCVILSYDDALNCDFFLMALKYFISDIIKFWKKKNINFLACKNYITEYFNQIVLNDGEFEFHILVP